MEGIVTLTLNPTIDGAAEAERVAPIRKVRTWGERYDPGGGGINASRVIRELGGDSLAIYLSGGSTGPILDGLIRSAGLRSRRVPIAGHTRISYTVHEQTTGLEYRFVPQGPAVEPAEWEAALDALESLPCAYLLASGSLPNGVPADFYARVGETAARKGAKLVLDTSGAALKEALKRRVHLVKPSLGELEDLMGVRLPGAAEQEAAAAALVRNGAAEMVALTLGRDGALLATPAGAWRLDGIPVKTQSAVGAGDSFLGAMTLALATGKSALEAFTLGAAAGTAAVMTMGTELCRRADVERLYAQIQAGGGPRPVSPPPAASA
ncbi:MAG TPA: hexose kinase [Xanthobacteraceae bacterium]|nr:hexose kinase [Xanthobacteraceae bacterium]